MDVWSAEQLFFQQISNDFGPVQVIKSEYIWTQFDLSLIGGAGFESLGRSGQGMQDIIKITARDRQVI